MDLTISIPDDLWKKFERKAALKRKNPDKWAHAILLHRLGAMCLRIKETKEKPVGLFRWDMPSPPISSPGPDGRCTYLACEGTPIVLHNPMTFEEAFEVQRLQGQAKKEGKKIFHEVVVDGDL